MSQLQEPSRLSRSRNNHRSGEISELWSRPKPKKSLTTQPPSSCNRKADLAPLQKVRKRSAGDARNDSVQVCNSSTEKDVLAPAEEALENISQDSSLPRAGRLAKETARGDYLRQVLLAANHYAARKPATGDARSEASR